MPERSSLNQVIQLGVETVPGTSVAASKRLQSISIEPSPSVDTSQFRPAGQKFNALSTLSKEWTEADLSGRGTFSELIYPLSSVLTGTPVITTPEAGPAPNARKWVFTPSSTADDVPKTFTIEHGSGVRADKFSYGLVNEFGMTFNRDAVEVSGSMLGRALVDNIVLTPAPTTVELIPILPTQVSIYMDTTGALLGTTKLTRALSAEFSIGSRYGPVWIVDAANQSFVNHVETEPDVTLSIMVEADAQGMGLLSQLRDGSTRFVRVEAVGALIGGATYYKFTLDFAGKVTDTGGFSDEDGVYAIEWSFIGVHDGVWNKALEISLVNQLAVL